MWPLGYERGGLEAMVEVILTLEELEELKVNDLYFIYSWNFELWTCIVL